MEFQDGKVRREMLYFANPIEAPEWRAQWVKRMKSWGRGSPELPRRHLLGISVNKGKVPRFWLLLNSCLRCWGNEEVI